ncbi:MAG TPA: carboxypeptidase-like regulatory domain-containing protein, partial [Flavobacteriia bacterium]|nr:carboxypeptidase-like regulatory domain-containing protein [Flavobacteriia bacterium]
MKKYFIVTLLGIFSFLAMNAQQTVKGKVLNSDTEKAIANVKVSVQGTDIEIKTPANGVFILKNVPKGEQIIEIYLNGFERQLFPVVIKDKPVDLGEILLYEDLDEESDYSEIILSDDELSDDQGGADNTSGLLQSSRDAFVRAAAFNFSWFRSRGYDSDNAYVLMNGIKMNKVATGRPLWTDWGGLNDVLRNQEFTYGLAPADKTFGGPLGATSFNTRAS